MLDFAALPPEINSGLMYAGPGSGPMLAASVAWDALARQPVFESNLLWVGDLRPHGVVAARHRHRWRPPPPPMCRG